MTVGAVVLCLLCQVLIVVGQLFLKHGLSPAGGKQPTILPVAIGIGCMSVWFFLWLGLMGRWELSKLFPFEGMNPAMMTLGAWAVLREKMSLHTWLGVGLICVGVAVVAGS